MRPLPLRHALHGHQIGNPQDAVEGRADLVPHPGDEHALGQIGAGRLHPRLHQARQGPGRGHRRGEVVGDEEDPHQQEDGAIVRLGHGIEVQDQAQRMGRRIGEEGPAAHVPLRCDADQARHADQKPDHRTRHGVERREEGRNRRQPAQQRREQLHLIKFDRCGQIVLVGMLLHQLIQKPDQIGFDDQADTQPGSCLNP